MSLSINQAIVTSSQDLNVTSIDTEVGDALTVFAET